MRSPLSASPCEVCEKETEKLIKDLDIRIRYEDTNPCNTIKKLIYFIFIGGYMMFMIAFVSSLTTYNQLINIPCQNKAVWVQERNCNDQKQDNVISECWISYRRVYWTWPKIKEHDQIIEINKCVSLPCDRNMTTEYFNIMPIWLYVNQTCPINSENGEWWQSSWVKDGWNPQVAIGTYGSLSICMFLVIIYANFWFYRKGICCYPSVNQISKSVVKKFHPYYCKGSLYFFYLGKLLEFRQFRQFRQFRHNVNEKEKNKNKNKNNRFTFIFKEKDDIENNRKNQENRKNRDNRDNIISIQVSPIKNGNDNNPLNKFITHKYYDPNLLKLIYSFC